MYSKKSIHTMAPVRNLFDKLNTELRGDRVRLGGGIIVAHVTAINLLLCGLLLAPANLMHSQTLENTSLFNFVLSSIQFKAGACWVAFIFTVLCLFYYCSRIVKSTERLRDSQLYPFPNAIGISYIIHIAIGLAIVLVIFSSCPSRSAANHELPARAIVVPTK